MGVVKIVLQQREVNSYKPHSHGQNHTCSQLEMAIKRDSAAAALRSCDPWRGLRPAQHHPMETTLAHSISQHVALKRYTV